MQVISSFVREQNRYTKAEIKSIFKLGNNEVNGFIRRLKIYGIMKLVKYKLEDKNLSDLNDDQIEVTDVGTEDDDFFYVFTYVGVITIGSRVIKSYPKYITSNESPTDDLKQVLKVISKYGSDEAAIKMHYGDAEYDSMNLLSVIMYLLNDFHDYGVYSNTEDIIEIDGEGEILWDNTIHESFCFIQEEEPYYLELKTCRTVDDDYDYFKRLHECILTECSNKLENSGLNELFDLVTVNLSDEHIDDFGDIDYILYKLNAELNIQYNTRRQLLLKTLYAYVSHDNSTGEDNGVSMVGTNNFNLVWENVCSKVFENKLNTELRFLNLTEADEEIQNKYDKTKSLKELIEKPLWIPHGSEKEKEASQTLKPDLIAIWCEESDINFYILDAKYYIIQLEKNKSLKGVPGVGDVTKQYLYQLAFKEFIKDFKFTKIKNCFIMPTEDNEVVIAGVAKMKMLSQLNLQDIDIRLAPARRMFDLYLQNKVMSINELKL